MSTVTAIVNKRKYFSNSFFCVNFANEIRDKESIVLIMIRPYPRFVQDRFSGMRDGIR